MRTLYRAGLTARECPSQRCGACNIQRTICLDGQPLNTSARATIRPIAKADFPLVAELAHEIWCAHYITIITKAQIDYMLAGRFSPENLHRYIDASDRWMEVLDLQGKLVGYCSYAFTSTAHEMKLEQLYLLPSLHGQGLGKLMLDHVERRTISLECDSLVLQVNKRNEKAIKVYRRGGFAVREEVVVDIGNGFVMDDYIMSKRLIDQRDKAR